MEAVVHARADQLPIQALKPERQPGRSSEVEGRIGVRDMAR